MNSGISCHHQRLIHDADDLSRIFLILSETGQSSKAPPTKFSPWQKLDKKLNRLNILKCVFLSIIVKPLFFPLTNASVVSCNRSNKS